MSKKESPSWREPFAEWQQEAMRALADCWSASPASHVHQIARTIVAFEKLGKHEVVELLMRQHLGQHGPCVLPVRTRHERRSASPSSHNRKLLWPWLASIAIDANLRPQRQPHTPPEKQLGLWSAYLVREARQRAIIDRLLAEQRQRLCAAGYLLLITALAFEGAGAVMSDRKVAKAVAAELLHATAWLYGKPCCKPVISLVRAITGVKLAISSVRWLARQQQQQQLLLLLLLLPPG
jgi:hypothetical protein